MSACQSHTGNHSSYFYGEYGFEENYAKKVTVKFLDINVDSLSFYNTDKKIYLKEHKIASNKIDKGLIVHIAIPSNRNISIDELTKIVESIQLK